MKQKEVEIASSTELLLKETINSLFNPTILIGCYQVVRERRMHIRRRII